MLCRAQEWNRTSKQPEPRIRARGIAAIADHILARRMADSGKLVGPGVPSVLTDGKRRSTSNRRGQCKSTGRRLAFEWTAQPEHR
jgi:hypothetical protein